MRIQSDSVSCPVCGSRAQLALLQHVDEQGHPFRQEFVLHCPAGHSPAEPELIDLWASARAGEEAMAGGRH